MRRILGSWLPILVVVGLMLVGLVASCDAALEDCFDSVVQIRAPNRAAGEEGLATGNCFAVDDQAVWIITNAHVVHDIDVRTGRVLRQNRTVLCDFFSNGYRFKPVVGTVCQWVFSDDLDAAVVRVLKDSPAGWAPKAVPLGRADPQLGDVVYSIGCARGAWPSLWRGHVVKAYDGQSIGFVPSPESGRSGSVLLNESGTAVVGLVFSNQGPGPNRPHDRGAAFPVTKLVKYLSPSTTPTGGCPGGVCPSSGPLRRQYYPRSQRPPAAVPSSSGSQAFPQLPASSFAPLPPPPSASPPVVPVVELPAAVIPIPDPVTSTAPEEGLAEAVKQLQRDLKVEQELRKDLEVNLARQRATMDYHIDDAQQHSATAPVDVDAAVDQAVAAQEVEIENKIGFVRDLIAKWEKDPVATKAELKEDIKKVGAVVEKVQQSGSPWALTSLFGLKGLLIGVLGVGGVLGYRRIANKVKNGEKLLVEKIAPKTTAAVVGVAEHVKDQFDEAVESLLGEARAERLKQVGEDARAKAKEVLGRVLK